MRAAQASYNAATLLNQSGKADNFKRFSNPQTVILRSNKPLLSLESIYDIPVSKKKKQKRPLNGRNWILLNNDALDSREKNSFEPWQIHFDLKHTGIPP